MRTHSVTAMQIRQIPVPVSVFSTVSKFMIFWIATPCSLVGGHWRFGGTRCLCLVLKTRRRHISEDQSTRLRIERTLVPVTFFNSILKVFDSNLGRDNGYTDWGISCFFLYFLQANSVSVSWSGHHHFLLNPLRSISLLSPYHVPHPTLRNSCIMS